MKHQHHKDLQGGYVMTMFLIIFIVVSTGVVFGIVTPTVGQVRFGNILRNSITGYVLAESGLEDAVYRHRQGMQTPSQILLTVDGSTVTTDISDVGSSQKTIESNAIVQTYERTVTADLITGVGASFNYGVQVGNGGFQISNNAGVVGNVYSNGTIVGAPGAYIEGSALSANGGGSLTMDQQNDSPTTPSNEIIFAKTSSEEDFAQSFQVTSTDPINTLSIYIKKNSNPSNCTVYITDDNSGQPGSTVLTQGTLNASQVTTSYSWVDVVFTNNGGLSTSTTYWFIVDCDYHNIHYYTIGANNAYPSGVANIGEYNTSWSATSPPGLDAAFELYVGGILGSIEEVIVGLTASDSAHANTVTNVDVTGPLYCQTGSGNNKTCDTSQPDPDPQPLPISDGNIAQWKVEAESGGTIPGDYTVPGTSSTLGPKRITGDLTVTNGHTLTITGTIWVEGDIVVEENADIELVSTFGADSGVLMATGIIDLDNNVDFLGSGHADSFVLLLSESTCNGTICSGIHAIEVSNNVGAVILNAQKGSVHFVNNAGAKTATADLIILEPNVEITYDSGLVNVNFSNGPSGGWNIINWEEIE